MLNIDEIKALATDAKGELEKMGVSLTVPAISVDVFNDISPKTAPKLRKLVSLANVYIPALIAEVERLQKIVKMQKASCNLVKTVEAGKTSDENIALKKENATLKKALMQAIRESHTDLSPASHQKLFDHYIQAQQPSCHTCQKQSGCQHRRFEPNDYEPCAEYEPNGEAPE